RRRQLPTRKSALGGWARPPTRSEGKAGEETWSLSESTISPRLLHAEADGNRTRQRARRPLYGFEDRGAHQEPRRLRNRAYRVSDEAMLSFGSSAASVVRARARLGCWDHGSGLLRPGQDDHLALVLARPLAPSLPRGDGLAGPVAPRGLRAAGVPPGGSRRAEDGAAERGDASAHEGLGPRTARTTGRGSDLGRDRSVRVPGGPRSHRAAPQRGPADLHRVLVARRDRSAAGPTLRGGGRDSDARGDRRRRPVHGRARVLRLR